MDRLEEEPKQTDLTLDRFELCRDEFFAHKRQPGLTLSNGKVQANTACIRKMKDVDFVQILINRETHKLAIRACGEEELFSLRWVRVTNGVRYPRAITGRIFFMKVCALMGWNPDNKICMLGHFYRANEDLLFLFDMDYGEEYPREVREDGKKRTSRVPHFAPSLENVFGPLYADHRKSLGINLYQGFAVMSVKNGELRPRGMA